MSKNYFEDRVVLVSGANRGIGLALVEALLKLPVKKIYATARDLSNLRLKDPRLVPIELDITKEDQVQRAGRLAHDADIVINNAGSLAFAPIAGGDWQGLAQDMEVNYFGTARMVRTFVPLLEGRSKAAIVNFSSIIGLAPMAGVGGYSASKAAVASATQALRAELKSKGISVHAVYPGPIDTDMAKEFNLPKTSASEAAANILKGLAEAQEDIFPDPMAQSVAETWFKDPKGLERQFAAMA